MAVLACTTTELADLLRSPHTDATEFDVVIVDIDRDGEPDLDAGTLPVVIVGIDRRSNPAPPPVFCDVRLRPDDPACEAIIRNVDRFPLAASALAVLLRTTEASRVDHALAAESAVYSMLQSGPEFARWRAESHHAPPPPDAEPPVLASRENDLLLLELNRPRRHNAFSTSMRDSLCEYLALALVDTTISSVEISGRGPSFCSGGDLGEFGSLSDPASAHAIRLRRSAGRLLAGLGERTRVHLHGSCIGAGIELAAFAQYVSAEPGTTFTLPEIGLGLIPGAGGTVSIPRRIGRHRTALLALTLQPISAERALRWSLIDEVAERTGAYR